MKPQKIRLKRGFAVGSALLVGSSAADTLKYTPEIPVTIRDATAFTGSTIQPVGTVEADAVQPTIDIEPEITEWRAADARRFKELAMKRATLEASADENREFIALQRRRRIYESKGSAEEVLNEWRRRRFVSQLIDLLSCNVTFFKPADQKRIRAFGHASRE
jgi:hypothetical protein